MRALVDCLWVQHGEAFMTLTLVRGDTLSPAAAYIDDRRPLGGSSLAPDRFAWLEGSTAPCVSWPLRATLRALAEDFEAGDLAVIPDCDQRQGACPD